MKIVYRAWSGRTATAGRSAGRPARRPAVRGRGGAEPVEQRVQQRLAAAHPAAHRADRGRRRVDQRADGARHHRHLADRARLQERGQRPQVAGLLVVGQQDLRAGRDGGEQLQRPVEEAQRALREPHVRGVDRVAQRLPGEPVRHGPLGADDALGHAGGAGGEQQVGGVVAVHAELVGAARRVGRGDGGLGGRVVERHPGRVGVRGQQRG